MGYDLYQRDGGTRWHAYFIDRNGERQRKSTKQTDKRKAVIVADEWYRRLADPTYSAANATTVQVACGNLIAALKRAKRSAATTGHFYPTKLGHFLRLWTPDIPLARIDAKLVDGYIATREQEGATAHTISKELGCLRMLLKHARRRGEFSLELSQVMPIGFASGYKPRTRRLTMTEAMAFIRELPENIRRYVCFVLCTTARDAAVARARGRHITRNGIEVFDLKTKGSARTVPGVEFLFPFAVGAFWGIADDQPIAPGLGSVRHAFDRAAKRLGVAHVSPNDLRRSVAHWLLERGVPRDAAAAFMGHANTKMLDAVYGKLDAKELGATITRALLTAPAEVAAPRSAVPCVQCGRPVDDARRVYAEPTCYACLPAPSPLPIATIGSSVEGSWKNGSSSGDPVDSEDTETLEKECAGAESNRRHGDFQPPTTLGETPSDCDEPPPSVAGSWKAPCQRPDLSWLLEPCRAALAAIHGPMRAVNVALGIGGPS